MNVKKLQQRAELVAAAAAQIAADAGAMAAEYRYYDKYDRLQDMAVLDLPALQHAVDELRRTLAECMHNERQQ